MGFKDNFQQRRKNRQGQDSAIQDLINSKTSAHKPSIKIIPESTKDIVYKSSTYSLLMLIIGCIVLIATSVVATPILQANNWQAPIAIVGFIVSAICFGSVLLRLIRQHFTPGKFPIIITAILAIITTSFFIGANNTLIINGKAYLSTSETAQAYRYSQQTYKDYLTISEYDDWIMADSAATQARIDKFEPASKKLKSISKAYTTGTIKPPSAKYNEVNITLAQATLLQAEALELKEQFTTRQDVSIENSMKAKRAAYGQLIITAMNDVNTIGSTYYHFNMDNILKGPRE